METKNEQNISDIFDSFVEARERDNNIKSSLILIETKDERLIHVKGGRNKHSRIGIRTL